MDEPPGDTDVVCPSCGATRGIPATAAEVDAGKEWCTVCGLAMYEQPRLPLPGDQ